MRSSPTPESLLLSAVGFAKLFVRGHRDLDEGVFSVLKAEFSDKEIVELFAYMSFICASQMFGASFDLKPRETYESLDT